MTSPTGQPSIFGGIGKLEFAPTNAPDDPFPTYVDITVFVRTEATPVSITRGRQTELDTIQPSQMTCILDNTDGRFTFGLTTGPYGANWTAAKKIRYSETIGSRSFILFTGYIEAPDLDSWQPIGYQEVNLSCTDRLTRLGRGAPFVSTLGAYIKGAAAASQLIGLWPMADDSSTVQNDIGAAGTGGPLAVGTYLQEPSVAGVATFRANQATPVLADDLTPGLFTTVPGVATTTAKSVWFSSVRTLVQTDATATVAWWQYWDDANSAGPEPIQVSGSPNSIQFFRSLGVWKINDGTTSNALPGPLPTYKWTLCAVHWTATTIEFWQDANAPVVFGHAVGSLNAKGIFVGQFFGGSMAYVQLYDGPAYTNAAHVAQFQAGQTALEYQTTGQRINTVLDYAGVPAGQRQVDPGVSFMQVASLATRDPGSALANAVATERGRGFISGDGSYVFHDRTRIYNV